MADHSPTHTPRGLQDHKDTYEGFLTGSVALGMICGFILVALVAFRFMDYLNVLTGFGGLILGTLATLIDGTRQVEYMSIEEVNEIRERSETYKAHKAGKIQSCTWITDAGEMTRKTVIKRIYKYLPRTDRMTQIDEAIAADNSDFAISDAQAYYIESLIATSTLEERQRGAIEMEVPVMSSSRATEVIEMLKANQQLSDRETLKRLQSK